MRESITYKHIEDLSSPYGVLQVFIGLDKENMLPKVEIMCVPAGFFTSGHLGIRPFVTVSGYEGWLSSFIQRGDEGMFKLLEPLL